ncbi:MAG: hypothetical protein CMJ52_07950 [Planctomycetaceae bacterium]|nr:hypothetical protein [Planctomycetaceae bacterium]|tara:strand:+ start:8529 stop:9761 length:1233 start_codon:yes stop_codon:yes gene_type:complete
MDREIPDFAKIMKMAQQVASQIEPPESLKSGQMNQQDVSEVIAKIGKSVGEIITPEMLTGGEFNIKEKPTCNPKKNKKNGKSKISFSESDIADITDEIAQKEKPPEEKKPDDKRKKRYVEIHSTDEESDEDPTVPRTKDMTFTLSVTLDELFTGAKKKLALRRKKLDKDGSYEEEKKKLSIKIEPGMIEEQVIRFNHMADEKQGYETGDVVVSLDVEDHAEFTRIGNDLIVEREISFSEAYDPVVYIKHLNGKKYKITGSPIEIFNNLDEELLKKIPGLGMPIAGETNEYGDMYIKFTCVNKTKITKDILEQLKVIFPSLTKEIELDENESFIEEEFEMVTESDLEYLESDSDSDSEYDSDEDSETDSEEYSDEECGSCSKDGKKCDDKECLLEDLEIEKETEVEKDNEK